MTTGMFRMTPKGHEVAAIQFSGHLDDIEPLVRRSGADVSQNKSGAARVIGPRRKDTMKSSYRFILRQGDWLVLTRGGQLFRFDERAIREFYEVSS